MATGFITRFTVIYPAPDPASTGPALSFLIRNRLHDLKSLIVWI
jgi:hypothetical protein